MKLIKTEFNKEENLIEALVELNDFDFLPEPGSEFYHRGKVFQIIEMYIATDEEKRTGQIAMKLLEVKE